MAVHGHIVCNSDCFSNAEIDKFLKFVGTLEQLGLRQGTLGSAFRLHIQWPTEVLNGDSDRTKRAATVYSRNGAWFSLLSCEFDRTFFSVVGCEADSHAILQLQEVLDVHNPYSPVMVLLPAEKSCEMRICMADSGLSVVCGCSLSASKDEVRRGLISWYAQHLIQDMKLVVLDCNGVDNQLIAALNEHFSFNEIEPLAVGARASSAIRKKLCSHDNNPKTLITSTPRVGHAHTNGIDCWVPKKGGVRNICETVERKIREMAKKQLMANGLK